jgi:hypothetical protein
MIKTMSYYGRKLQPLSISFKTKYKNKNIYKENTKLKAAQNSQYNIISNTNNKTYNILFDKEKYINQNEYIKNKKIISISPGGYKGVYMLGICIYIKDHFNLDNFIFSGASAGAWNSLMLCCKKDIHYFKTDIVDYSIHNSKTIFELEYLMKKKILQYYTTDDFELRKLFIGVTALNGYYPETQIFSNFNNLEDAINCCIASSHIPLVTGGFINKYNNMFTFDGGFSKTPYLNISENVLHITPSMWNTTLPAKRNSIRDLNEFTTLFSKHKYNFTELYVNGYHDAKKNHEYLKERLG